MDEVTLLVDEKVHTGWINVQIKKSLLSLSSSFTLTLRPSKIPFPNDWAIEPQKKCVVKIGKIPVVTGYIESVQNQLTSTSHFITVRGRDLTADLIDCPTGREGFSRQKLNLKQIINYTIEKFNVDVIYEASPIYLHPSFHVSEFEGVFSALNRAASIEGLLITTDGLGNLVVTRPKIKTKNFDMVLNEEDPILSIETSFDFQNRFSEYSMIIPNYAMIEEIENISKKLAGPVKDPKIKRFRPFSLSSNGYADAATAKKRLNWERTVRQAKSEKLKISFPKWGLTNGSIFELNKSVKVTFKELDIDGVYLTSEVEYKLDQSGHRADLTLTPAEAFTLDPTLYLQENNLVDLVQASKG